MRKILLDGLRCGRFLCCLSFSLLAYGAHAQEAPAWLSDGRPGAAAVEAVRILAAAADDGLNPEDYQAAVLARVVGAAQLTDKEQAELPVALTLAMQRYLSDLHAGRVNPRDIHLALKLAPKPFDAASYLRAALAEHRLTAAVRAAAPQLPLYAALREALGRYRLLADNPALQGTLPPLPGTKVEPGQRYAGLPALALRLIALGDLPAGTHAEAVYRGALVDGVKAFQLRHGLSSDGVLGKGTLAQLNLPVATRIRQIELTLERLRWTPLNAAERMIVVNVPEFALHAYENKKDGTRLSMNVIVGKALNTRTPLFYEDMRFIEFSPYWNIPPSIAKAETVPRLRRDPAYFNQEGLEFVAADGSASTVLTRASLDAVMRGELRIRQRPGPKNALGDIKFIFPNSDNIYLHHTPAVGLFGRNRRDFSHGCIRVEDPVALAKFVLQDQPEWSEERIRDAMESGKSSTLRLSHPLPVLITYGTVIVKQSGKVYFFDDIYANDKALDAALQAKTQARRARQPA